MHIADYLQGSYILHPSLYAHKFMIEAQIEIDICKCLIIIDLNISVNDTYQNLRDLLVAEYSGFADKANSHNEPN